jgi:hypothetical protein
LPESGTHRRGLGQPGIMGRISELIVRMAQENPSWGKHRHSRCVGQSRSQARPRTFAKVLNRNGIEPSREKQTHDLVDLLKSALKVLAASDFLTRRNANVSNHRLALCWLRKPSFGRTVGS